MENQLWKYTWFGLVGVFAAVLALTWQTHLSSNAHAPTHFHTPVISGMLGFSPVVLRHGHTHRQWVNNYVGWNNECFSHSVRPEEASSYFRWVLPPTEFGKSDWKWEYASVVWVYHGPDLTSLTSLMCHRLTESQLGYLSVCKRNRNKSC